MDKKGMTLPELLVIIAIICLLSAIAIPSILRARQEAESANEQAELKTLYTTLIMYQGNKGEFPKSWDDLETYLDVLRYKDKYEINPNY